MSKRRREAVIRFRTFSRETEPTNWFRANLMLYFPWYNEETDLLSGCSSYEEHYCRVHAIVSANEKRYTLSDIEDVELDENGPPQHVWDHTAPGTKANRANHEAERSELLTELSKQDVRDNRHLFTSTSSSSVHVRYENAASHGEILPDEYRNLLRSLNAKKSKWSCFIGVGVRKLP